MAASLLGSLQDVIDEAAAMSEASCDELKQAQATDPGAFRLVRGYAATLKNVVAQQPDIAADEEIKAALAALDTNMGELDGALRLCGITP